MASSSKTSADSVSGGILKVKRGAAERTFIVVLCICLAVAVLLSITVGRYAISIKELLFLIKAHISNLEIPQELANADVVLFIVRIPRIFLVILVGGSLALSGAAYQNMFRNPMVSPDILGITQAAGVGASIAILQGFNGIGLHLMSFAFGIAAVLLVMTIAKLVGRVGSPLTVLILTGMVVAFFFSSISSLTKYLADTDNQLPAITFWLMGSFAKSGNYKNVLVMLLIAICGVVPLLLMRWRINVLSFGDEEAQSMGVNVRLTRSAVIACATLLTAASVCFCGTIQWVGLIIPHIIRLLVGPNNRILFPGSLIGGGLFLLIVDNFARVIVPGELPIGIITSLIGAPLFIFILFKGRREWL